MVSLPESIHAISPARRQLIARAEQVLEGFDTPCEIVLAQGEVLRVGKAAPKFRIVFHDDRVILRGTDEYAFATAFVNGEMDIEGDMLAFFDVRTRLKSALGMGAWARFWTQLLFQAPTRVNRKAIQHHYEFGEDFFLCFMDRGYHLYSHGFFASDTESLERACERKLEVMFDWTQMKPGMRVLDIGAGWGAVIRYCAPKGVHVTSLTLAQDSHQHITRMLKEHGWIGQVLLEDYLVHQPAEPYDAIVILGVIEHIPYYRQFFQQAWKLLKPGGRIYMDASADIEKYEVSRYIREYIYPGTHSYMCLQDVLQEQLYHGFMPLQVANDNHNYMLTMRHWAERFEANKDMIRKRWGEQVYRSFWLYLWSGAYAFGHDVLQAYHLVAERTAEPGIRPGTLRRARNFVRQLF
jgi:cyclopropane-fatty-acyl-phospholipid synthase